MGVRAGREIQAHVGGMAQDRLHLGEPGKDAGQGPRGRQHRRVLAERSMRAVWVQGAAAPERQ